ncbi:hypothetical protein [Pseudoroseomonas sp. WGS1072]|uniref:hypothetical protein n=1 Tax=Roseomonas sp. WGS1072 TaxID=3366816 RepID=UPI003BF11CA8
MNTPAQSAGALTFARARACCRSYGCTLTRRPGGDYRVNFQGCGKETAYYTPDLDDACGTARAMFKQGRPASETPERRALRRAAAFIAGFEDDPLQEGIVELLAEIRSVLAEAGDAI